MDLFDDKGYTGKRFQKNNIDIFSKGLYYYSLDDFMFIIVCSPFMN